VFSLQRHSFIHFFQYNYISHINSIIMSSHPSSQNGEKKPAAKRPEDPSHPGMSPDPAERGRELGEENAYGGTSVGTGGHGKASGCGM
jgi:hypothetical protein